MARQQKPLIVRSWITENGVTKRYDTLPQEEKDRLSRKMMENCGRITSYNVCYTKLLRN